MVANKVAVSTPLRLAGLVIVVSLTLSAPRKEGKWCVTPAHTDPSASPRPGKTRTCGSQDCGSTRYRVRMRTTLTAVVAVALLAAFLPATASADGAWLDQPLSNWNQA